MAYSNTHRGARISPQKARLVADEIRGKNVDEALAILLTSKHRAAVMIHNALKAAINNADQGEADVRNLKVTEAHVDEGPTVKRFQPKDRGRAHQILKRTSHITVSVAEQETAQA